MKINTPIRTDYKCNDLTEQVISKQMSNYMYNEKAGKSREELLKKMETEQI